MNITDPIFQDPEKARVWFEKQRWPDGPYCPHCGNADQERIGKVEGKCAPSRPLPVQRMPQAVHGHGRHRVRALKGAAEQVARCDASPGARKKGMSAHQIHRMLGVTYQDRVVHGASHPRGDGRDAEVRPASAAKARSSRPTKPISARPRRPASQSSAATVPTSSRKQAEHKRAVVALVERGGEVRMMHVEECTAAELPRNPRPQRLAQVRAAYRRKPPLHRDRRGICGAPHRQALSRRICPLRGCRSFTPTRSRTCSACSSAA